MLRLCIELACKGVAEDPSNAEGRRRDYVVLLDNIMVAGGQARGRVEAMPQASAELETHYQMTNSVLFPKLGYIILMATAGPELRVFARRLGPHHALVSLLSLQVRCRLLFTVHQTSSLAGWQVTVLTGCRCADLDFAWPPGHTTVLFEPRSLDADGARAAFAAPAPGWLMYLPVFRGNPYNQGERQLRCAVGPCCDMMWSHSSRPASAWFACFNVGC